MKNNHPIFASSLLSSALLSLFYTTSVQAQSTVTTLDTIVATSETPHSALMFSANPKKPRQPIPASDGTDYLKTIPGFSALRNGGSNGDPVLRGMFGSRINILTNNSSMPGACGGRMDNPGAYIAPENFDQITVVKGPQTVLWGAGASAGTVRFNRETPTLSEQGEMQFEGSLLGASAGRHDQNADIVVGNNRFFTRLSANHSHAQNYKDGDGNTVHSRWDKWNTDLTLGLTPDPDTLYEFNLGFGDGEVAYATRGMDGTQFKRTTYGLRFEKQNMPGRLSKIETQLYYNQADHVMDNFRLRSFKPMGTMKAPVESNPRRTTWGGRLAVTVDLADQWSLITGVDFQESKHEFRGRMVMANPMPWSWRNNARFSNRGLFGELTAQLSEQSKIVSGLRLDYATATDFRPGSLTEGYRRRNVLPSAFIRYEHELADVPASVYIGLGHTQRTPDFWELVSPRIGPKGYKNAFEGIKPEKTTQLDIGAQYKGEQLQAWVSAYAGVVNDFILFDYNTLVGMSPARRADNIKARIMGAELGVDYRLTKNVTLGGTLAYAWGKNTTEGRPMAQMPPLELRLKAEYVSDQWSAGALWRLVSAQKRYAKNQGNVVSKDFGLSPGFGTLALHAAYAPNKKTTISVGIDNVFNKTYKEHLNLAGAGVFGYSANTQINEPGRTVWARIDLRF